MTSSILPARSHNAKKQLPRIMKLTTVLLIVTMMQVSAAGFAQRLTLNQRSISIKQVFKEIKKQTGYDVFYLPEMIKGNNKIKASFFNTPIEDVMERCLEGKSLIFKIEDKTVVVTKREPSFFEKINDFFAPPIDIKGRLIDENGDALVGASIVIKGTERKTVTRDNGEFSLTNVDEKAILVISFIGYETKEVSAISNLGNIKMALSTGKLDEISVVSTGYQTISKERAPGAFDLVRQDVLSKRPVSNISTALQGMVAGMQGKENADGSINFLIRGNSSMYVDARPLVVVDGFPVSGSDFSTINPNDVENITVLKDAAAASIWGARAANGVIVIVTKKGKTAKSGLTIDANVFTRIAKLTDLNLLLGNATSAEHVNYERMAFQNGWKPFSEYAGAFPTDLNKPLTLAQELLYANKAGRLSTPAMNTSLDSLGRIDNHKQISDQLLQRAFLTQYNVGLTQLSEKSRSYVSLMFEDNKSRYQGTGYNRYVINFNNEYKPAKFITFNFGLFLQYKKQQASGASLAEIGRLSPYETLLNPDGSYSANLASIESGGVGSAIGMAGRNRYLVSQLPMNQFPYSDWNYNLLREVRGRNLTSQEYNARIQTGFNIKILSGLSFDTKLQYERGKADIDNYYSEDTYYARDMVNNYVEYNNSTRMVSKMYLPKGGLGRSNNNNTSSYVFRNQFNYVKDLGTKHSINAIAGMEMSQYRADTRLNPWLYGYNPDRLQASVPPYGYGSSASLVKMVTGESWYLFDEISYGNGTGNTVLGYDLNRYVSFYGNASYTYDRKYTISGSVRSDASNFITKKSSLRWSPLWSVGGLWNIKEENFAADITWIDRLSLRATYGRNGNVEKSTSTSALIALGTTLSPTTGTLTAYVSDNGNPTLRWEKTTTSNLGVDFTLFKGQLFGKIDVYSKVGKDITGVVALAAATGTTSQKFNNAGITNRGIEVELGTQVKIPGIPVTYNTSLNYAYNKNEIKNLYYPTLFAYQMTSPGTTYVEGRPINPVYTFNYLGMNAGIPQVAGVNGSATPMDNTSLLFTALGRQVLNYAGTATPPHTAGWYNTFGYKNFNLSVLFIGKFGGVYRNGIFDYGTSVGSGAKTTINRYISDVYAGRADIPSFPRANDPQFTVWSLYAPYLQSLVESSSYIECKEITLDYNLSAIMSKKLGFRNVKVFAQMRDLGLVWAANKNGFNPDWLPGTDRPLGTYTLGLNVGF